MKMIKPIVNVSKVADAYDAVLCGFNGVLHDGRKHWKLCFVFIKAAKKSCF